MEKINFGRELAKLRWAKATKAEKKRTVAALNKARLDKMRKSVV